MDHGALKINYLAVRPERVEGRIVTLSPGGRGWACLPVGRGEGDHTMATPTPEPYEVQGIVLHPTWCRAQVLPPACGRQASRGRIILW